MKIAFLGFGHSTVSLISSVGQLDLVSEIAIIEERPALTCDLLQDLQQAIAISGSDTRLSATRDVADLDGSRIVILLPKSSRPMFQSTQAQHRANLAYTQHLAKTIKRYAPKAIILSALAPVCSLASTICRELEAETQQIIGLSGGFANAFLKTEIAHQLGVSVQDVTTLVIGNDAQIYPLSQYCRVGGIPLESLMSAEKLQELVNRANDKHRKFGGVETPHTLAAWVTQALTAIVLDKKRIMSVAARVQSGSASVYLNVPAKIGHHGVEAILRLDLSEAQKQQFTELVAKSVAAQRAA